MNSNWIHEDGQAYWKARGDKALALIKEKEKEAAEQEKNKKTCQKK